MNFLKITVLTALLISCLSIVSISAERNRNYPALTNIIKIELPLGLKWRNNLTETAKILKVANLTLQNTNWAKFEKEGHRYWLYFTNGQYLSQITVLFGSNSMFTKYMQMFTARYAEQRVKDNFFRDRMTTVGIEATLKPQVVYIFNE